MAVSVLYTNFGGMLVHEDRGGVERTYVHDEMGNTSYLVDSNGVTDSYEYTPYGQVTHAGVSVTPFTFIGALGCFATGWSMLTSYVRARWYSRVSGSWGSVDPIWPWQKAYQYVDGNPAMGIDPSGLLPANIGKLIWEVVKTCGIALFSSLVEPILSGGIGSLSGTKGSISLCKAGGACLGAIAGLIVGAVLTSSGVGSFFAGCAGAFVGSVLADIVSYLCDMFIPKPTCAFEKKPLPCLLIDSLLRGAIACLGGGIAGGISDPGQNAGFYNGGNWGSGLGHGSQTGTIPGFVGPLNEIRALLIGLIAGNGTKC